uniref:Uncharacterized protein n=1 Tax=Eccles virus TaxID=2170578 RepID=A0A2U3TMP0_9REOV|nr:hypothetical protein [Eccles virus]
MDHVTQQLVYEIRQLTTQIKTLSQKVTTLENRYAITHSPGFQGEERGLVTSTGVQGEFQNALMLMKPSREILDDFALLNESIVYPEIGKLLSDFECSFELVTDVSLLPDIFSVSEGSLKTSNIHLMLPFLIVEDLGDHQVEGNVGLSIHGHVWINRFKVFRISEDGLIFELNNFVLSHSVFESRRKYGGTYDSSPLSQNLADFISSKVHSTFNILGLLVHGLPTVNSLDGDVTLLLLVRALLFLRCEDFVTEASMDERKDYVVTELQKSLFELKNRTIIAAQIEFQTGLLLAKCSETCDLPLADVGDLSNSSIAMLLCPNLPLQGVGFKSSRLGVKISKSMKTSGFKFPVQLHCDGSQIEIELSSTAIFTRVFNLSTALSCIATKKREPNLNELFGDYLVVPYGPHKLRLSDIHYLSFYLRGNVVLDVGSRMISWDGNEWVLKGDLPLRFDEIRFSGSTYECTSHAISQYVEIFISYSSLLSYTAGKSIPVELNCLNVISQGLLGSFIESVTGEKHYQGTFRVVDVEFGDGSTSPLFHVRVPLDVVSEPIFLTRVEKFKFSEVKRFSTGKMSELSLLLETGAHFETEWLPTMINQKTGGLLQGWSGDLLLMSRVIIPVLRLPSGFSSMRHEYDFQYFEMLALLEGFIFRTGALDNSLLSLKVSLRNVENLTNSLVKAVNDLEGAFLKLKSQLQEASHVPVWKKVLSGIAMAGGLIAAIFMPFTLPFALAVLAGSTAISIGLMFADGDYIAGGVEVAGVLIGLGSGYYATRRATTKGFPVTSLSKAGAIEQQFPTDFDTRLLSNDGMWVEVKPLQMLGSRMEKVGDGLIKNKKGILSSLLKLEHAPVHARLRSSTTKVTESGEVVRTTIVTGVTDGMPYMSHINPRPGVYELLDRYENGKFVNGWKVENVPIGADFIDLPISIRGLLLEGVGTDVEYQSLVRSWRVMDGAERTIALNDAQDYIRRTQSSYVEVKKSKIPISFDESLVRNVSNTFAKHAGIYELTGFTTPGGANNCQTYANELRDFFAKGKLRSGKLSNTSFLNDLMDSFDNSTQFKHTYGPGLIHEKSSLTSNGYQPLQDAP